MFMCRYPVLQATKILHIEVPSVWSHPRFELLLKVWDTSNSSSVITCRTRVYTFFLRLKNRAARPDHKLSISMYW